MEKLDETQRRKYKDACLARAQALLGAGFHGGVWERGWWRPDGWPYTKVQSRYIGIVGGFEVVRVARIWRSRPTRWIVRIADVKFSSNDAAAAREYMRQYSPVRPVSEILPDWTERVSISWLWHDEPPNPVAEEEMVSKALKGLIQDIS